MLFDFDTVKRHWDFNHNFEDEKKKKKHDHFQNL